MDFFSGKPAINTVSMTPISEMTHQSKSHSKPGDGGISQKTHQLAEFRKITLWII